jgi:hypothetical protein
MDDGFSGIFNSIIGLTSYSMVKHVEVSSNIIKGRRYRFKYRVRNQIGWSSFSEECFVLAANEPSQPDIPYFYAF